MFKVVENVVTGERNYFNANNPVGVMQNEVSIALVETEAEARAMVETVA